MNTKVISIILIIIFILSVVPSALADSDDDKEYYILSADLFLLIENNGLLKVNESYNYTFQGQYNGVYRDIPIKEGQSVDNLKVSAEGAYTKVESKYDGNYYKIKVYLYSDPQLTKPIKDTSVTIHYNYDFKDVIKVYNDVGELHYQLWGSEWDKGVGKLVAQIQFPDNQKIEYWINPLDNEAKESWNGNILTIESNYIYSDSYLEFRGVIPLSEFKNPVYAHKINKDGYNEIVKAQKDYVNWEKLQDSLATIVPIILACSLLIPVFLYIRFGREPKIDYNAPYERELPTDDTPIFVDAMFGTKTDTGVVSDNGIQATIMELIKDKVITIADNESLKLVLPDSVEGLEKYKQNIINLILKPYAIEGVLDFKHMKSQLVHESQAKAFNHNLNIVKSSYRGTHILPVINEYFNSKGSDWLKVYSIALAVISFIILIYSIIQSDVSIPLFLFSLLFFIIGCSIWAIPNRIAGRWTVKGYTEYKKWGAFKKFIKDFSLIKQYPPESVAVWDKYLIYATALGSAKAVNKAMKTIGPAAEYDNFHSDIYFYSTFGGPALFTSAVRQSNTTLNNSGVGGAGGGSGGGGGGAF